MWGEEDARGQGEAGRKGFAPYMVLPILKVRILILIIWQESLGLGLY